MAKMPDKQRLVRVRRPKPETSQEASLAVSRPPAILAQEEAQAALLALDRRAEEAEDAAVPANTRRAYEFELACFSSWCARHRVPAMPAPPKAIRAYLQELSEQGRSPDDMPRRKRRSPPKGPLGHSALTRALGAICRSHRNSGHTSPWHDPTITGMRDTFARTKGTAPKKQKHDLGATGDAALLFRVCDLMEDDLRGIRDRAMILVGWQGGGRRRSEIAGALVEHFHDIDGGMSWLIPKSKADQVGKGLVVALTPAEDERYCAVRALRRWLSESRIESGHVFRGIHTANGKPLDAGIDPGTVSRRVKFYVEKLGLDSKDFGGHSIRSGFITSAHRLGRTLPDIMQSTGHHSIGQVMGYIRRAGLVQDSAAKGLIDEAMQNKRDRDGSR